MSSFLRAYFSGVQMLQTVKDASALDPLVDLLESIEFFLNSETPRRLYQGPPHSRYDEGRREDLLGAAFHPRACDQTRQAKTTK
jgi:hypothetical protein